MSLKRTGPPPAGRRGKGAWCDRAWSPRGKFLGAALWAALCLSGPVGAAGAQRAPVPPVLSEDVAALRQADQDIARLRMGTVALRVLNADGRPIPHLRVTYAQRTHEVLFGIFQRRPYTAWAFDLLRGAGINHATLHFNWAAVEPRPGRFEWAKLEETWGPHRLAEAGWTLKGHALNFFAEDTTPRYLRALSAPDLDAAIYAHVFALVSRYRQDVAFWEAINEPRQAWSNVLLLNDRQILEVARTASRAIRDAQPAARILVNLGEPQAPWDFGFVGQAMEAGLDFDAIGLQFYHNGRPWGTLRGYPQATLPELRRTVDHYAGLQKDLHITELSVPSEAPPGGYGYRGIPWSPDLQAWYLQAAYALFFAQPRVKAITWWDLTDRDPQTGDHAFIYKGGLVDERGQPKPAYHALKALLEGWTTRGAETTGEDGELRFRGFGGAYEVVLTDPATGERGRVAIELHERQVSRVVLSWRDGRAAISEAGTEPE